MDTTLVSVTLLSMGMALALSVIVWRMLRDERQRSDARVSALAGLSVGPMASAGRPKAVSAEPLDLPIRPSTQVNAASTPVAMGSMFEEVRQPSPWGHRFAVMGGLALVLGSVILLALAANGTKASARGGSPVTRATPTAAPTAAGLELISLRDSRQAGDAAHSGEGALTITGMVRNPATGSPLSRVAVTVYTFDGKGSFLASGRALIDVTSLAPGDESPFVVTVPVTDTVARYRIGFRSEDGKVIAHVDKRQQGPIAALRENSGQPTW